MFQNFIAPNRDEVPFTEQQIFMAAHIDEGNESKQGQIGHDGSVA